MAVQEIVSVSYSFNTSSSSKKRKLDQFPGIKKARQSYGTNTTTTTTNGAGVPDLIIMSTSSTSSSASSDPENPNWEGNWTADNSPIMTTINSGTGASNLETSNGVSWVRLSLLGKGGFGSVFLAKTKTAVPINQESKNLFNLPSYMAVKSAPISKSSSLEHEKQILYDLTTCPYVVRCYGDEITELKNGEKIYNLLLEFCPGLSMYHHVIISDVGLAEEDVRAYTRDIVGGLKYIHGRGYVHCDIKLDNILLVPTACSGTGERSRRFIAKIADFGLAIRVCEAEEEEGKSTKRRGTQVYMSPELVRDTVFKFAADIWALGCCVVEMLNGPEWPAMARHDAVRALGYGIVVPSVTRRRISDDAQDFLDKCFTRCVDDRWSAARLLQHRFLSPG